MQLIMNVNRKDKVIPLHSLDEQAILGAIKDAYKLWAPMVTVTYQNENTNETTVVVQDHEFNHIGQGVLAL